MRLDLVINIFVYNSDEKKKNFYNLMVSNLDHLYLKNDIVKIYKYIIKKITYHHLFVIWFNFNHPNQQMIHKNTLKVSKLIKSLIFL